MVTVSARVDENIKKQANEVLKNIGLDREAATDVKRIQFRTDFLQVAVQTDALRQLIPVVCSILNARIDEEMQHLQLELRIVLDFMQIERNDVVVADA